MTTETLAAEAATPTSTRLLQRYMPALDVLRGAAILLVIFDHALYWMGAAQHTTGVRRLFAELSSGGWLGVNLFFVLSGFLITGILLDSRGNEGYFKRFYLRRATRILPAYLLTIIVLLLLHRMPTAYLIASLLFLTNYSGAFGGTLVAVYSVFWSLSVEEQFYLLWPTIVRRLRRSGLAVLCIALVVADPVLRYLAQAGRAPLGNPHTNTFLIADNLACGALAALFVRTRFGDAVHGRRAGLALIGASCLILLAGLPFGILHRNAPFGAALQSTPWNLLFTGTLLLLLSLPTAWFAGTWSAPLRFFGYISYGLYLCHLLVFDFYDVCIADAAPAVLRPVLHGYYVRLLLAGALSTLVAFLSRRFYEDPFLRWHVTRQPRKLLQQAP